MFGYNTTVFSVLNIFRFRTNNIFKNLMMIRKSYCTNFSKSYYSVLGLKPEATDKEIKQAYYSLSKKYHPDLNIGDKNAESKILEINAAFEVLGNKAEREKYDDKMFPKIWEKNSFAYDFKPEPEKTPDYTYRRVFKDLTYAPNWYRHAKGLHKRNRRHSFQKYTFNKSQSSGKFCKVNFK